MSRVLITKYGVWCYRCGEVHPDTDACEHDLGDKAGIRNELSDGFVAKPADMGHHGPHHYIEVEGMQQCALCDQVKIPKELVEVSADA